MTTNPTEQPPTEQPPKATPPPIEQPPKATPPPIEPDPDALSPEQARPPAPKPNEGTGQYAVYDHDLGQFVSGVSDEATADKARKGLEDHNGAITDGHKLSTVEV